MGSKLHMSCQDHRKLLVVRQRRCDKCSSNASITPPNLHKCAHACTSHSSHCSLLTVALLSALDDAVPGVLGCEGAATGTSLRTVSCRRTSGALPRSPSIAAVSPLECSDQSSRQDWLGDLPMFQESSANSGLRGSAFSGDVL